MTGCRKVCQAPVRSRVGAFSFLCRWSRPPLLVAVQVNVRRPPPRASRATYAADRCAQPPALVARGGPARRLPHPSELSLLPARYRSASVPPSAIPIGRPAVSFSCARAAFKIFTKLAMDCGFAIGYTPVSASKRNHILVTRDRLDAISLQDSRVRGWMSPHVSRLCRPVEVRLPCRGRWWVSFVLGSWRLPESPAAPSGAVIEAIRSRRWPASSRDAGNPFNLSVSTSGHLAFWSFFWRIISCGRYELGRPS